MKKRANTKLFSHLFTTDVIHYKPDFSTGRETSNRLRELSMYYRSMRVFCCRIAMGFLGMAWLFRC